MKWFGRSLEILLAIGLAAYVLDPNRTLSGLLHGEAFYQLRPTSYWRREVMHCPKYPHYTRHEELRPCSCIVGVRGVSWLDRMKSRFFNQGATIRLSQLPLREEDPRAMPVLRELLQDSSPVVRMYAAETIGGLGPLGQPAASHLIPLLTDKEIGSFGFTVAEKAAWSLGQIGPDARDAVPTLLQALNDEHHGLACAAALALIRIEPDGAGRTGLAWLSAALKDPDKDKRVQAAVTLGEAGPLAKPALPAMIEAALGQDAELQAAAVTALKFIDLEAAMNAGVPPD